MNKWIKGTDGEYVRNPDWGKKPKNPKVLKKPKYKVVFTPKARVLSEIPDWSKIRRSILERDKHMCRICGLDAVEATMNIHHIDYCRDHNEDENLVTLCATCHRQVHVEGYIPCDHLDHPIPWGLT
jgi:5-methylcytosine-specific restriction endonuclease McrA